VCLRPPTVLRATPDVQQAPCLSTMPVVQHAVPEASGEPVPAVALQEWRAIEQLRPLVSNPRPYVSIGHIARTNRMQSILFDI
jgi:hypothetical protein